MRSSPKQIPVQSKRIYALMAAILFVLSLLILRLALLQLSPRTDASDLWEQSVLAMDGFDARGTIYDADRIPLTGSTTDTIYILDQNSSSRREQLLALISAQKITSNPHYDVYRTSIYHPYATELLQKEYGAFVLRTTRRYSQPQLACHLIGYIQRADKQGMSGLEKTYDAVLRESTRELYARVDATGAILPGLGVIEEVSSEPNGLVISLRSSIQREVERILTEQNKRSSVVVLDAATGDLVASASYPFFYPGSVEQYLESDSMELFHQATQGQYPPGSLFKIIVAAAALEQNVAGPATLFHCDGAVEINGVRIRCSSGGESGHGDITLAEAFSQSCNVAFIQLGILTGGEEILSMAEQFGLGNTLLGGVVEENPGLLPDRKDIMGAGIGNLSIGQGKLLITPLQAARVSQVIVNDGRDVPIRLVHGLLMAGDFEPQLPTVQAGSFPHDRQIISPKTAKLLKQWMVDTVEVGTADNYSGAESQSAGGKTGSAQSSSNGEKVVHAWFTGFVPAEDPRYVISVVVEDGGSGRTTAVPLFEKISQILETE